MRGICNMLLPFDNSGIIVLNVKAKIDLRINLPLIVSIVGLIVALLR